MQQTTHYSVTTLSVDQLISIFNDLFCKAYNTKLCGGASEPLYAPAGVDHNAHIAVTEEIEDAMRFNRIYFRHDYISSLLHEVAHWCLAGAARREKLDYGYWYSPDDRNAQQQLAFEQVEVKPQALEKIFSQACGIDFAVSADNLALQNYDVSVFAKRVEKRAEAYLIEGLPSRASQFLNGILNVTQNR